MKTTSLLTTFTFTFLMLFSFSVNGQEFKDLDKSPMDAAAFPSSYKDSNKLVKVIYSRPQLKGRDLATLAKPGEVWRTGANESAEITFYQEAKLGNETIKLGTYSLFTIPGEKEWVVIFNSDLNTWGSYFYDESKNVVKVTVPVTEGKDALEAFSIAFDEKGKMHLGWDKVRVEVPFEF